MAPIPITTTSWSVNPTLISLRPSASETPSPPGYPVPAPTREIAHANTSTTHTRTDKAIIAGAVVAGLVLGTALCALVWAFQRWRARWAQAAVVTPFLPLRKLRTGTGTETLNTSENSGISTASRGSRGGSRVFEVDGDEEQRPETVDTGAEHAHVHPRLARAAPDAPPPAPTLARPPLGPLALTHPARPRPSPPSTPSPTSRPTLPRLSISSSSSAPAPLPAPLPAFSPPKLAHGAFAPAAPLALATHPPPPQPLPQRRASEGQAHAYAACEHDPEKRARPPRPPPASRQRRATIVHAADGGPAPASPTSLTVLPPMYDPAWRR